MQVLKCDLPKTLEELEISLFADEHIGDPSCDLDHLKARIEYVKTHDNVYAILNGDIINNATKTSVSDTYSETLNPQGQIDLATELFMPIKHKILFSNGGNHEARTYKKEGIDPGYVIANNLGLGAKYSPVATLLFIRFGTNDRNRKHLYTVYATHGSGGGRKEGAKIIRLCDLAAIVDADVYIHSHTHLPIITKEDFYRVSFSNSSVAPVTKLFVNTSANLNYGGYGETMGCKPASKDRPRVFLNGKVKDAKAML